MQPSKSPARATLPIAVLLAVVAALALVAGGVFGRGVDPSPTPSNAPSSPPSVEPNAPASPQPSVTPTDEPADGPFKVHLDNITDHDLSVVIKDETGSLADATSGQPGDGMTVRWLDVKVENVDADTVRVVWVGLPRDEEIQLSITEKGGAYALHFIQAAPPANSDAVGYDRILVLRFGVPVSADDVKVTFATAG